MTELPWSLIVPVKSLALAKSRLADAAGPFREAFALAVATDTVTAALRCTAVGAVIVVTDDPRAARDLAAAGATIVPDEPDCGLNPALRYGASRAAPLGYGLAAISADLPALRPAELKIALDAASRCGHAFVPDLAGTGTTLYTAGPGAEFAPAFGNGSRDRHAAQGVHELILDGTTTVRQDVDTLADLKAALALGLGPHTAAVAKNILDRVLNHAGDG